MSKLEEDTKPILSPFILDPAGSRRLTRYDQLVIANWTMLRLMVFSRAHDPDCAYYSSFELKKFKNPKHRQPIPNSRVWLAWLPDPGQMYLNVSLHGGKHPEQGYIYLNFNCVLGPLGIQMVHWCGPIGDRIISPDGSKTINLTKLQEQKYRDTLVKIWPRERLYMSWPPRCFTRAEIKPFYNRFFLPGFAGTSN